MDYIYIFIQIFSIIGGSRSIMFGIRGITKHEVSPDFFFPWPATKISGKTAVILGYGLILLGIFIILLPLILLFP